MTPKRDSKRILNLMEQAIIAIIGGGAAGFFAAINTAIEHPEAQVHIFEKSNHVLTKVRISGGGRCNVTHSCFDPKLLAQHYPRGSKELLSVFYQFNPEDTLAWFKKRGVDIIREDDGRMFPSTHKSESIINVFLDEAKRLGIKIHFKSPVNDIRHQDETFTLTINNEHVIADAVILTTGGGVNKGGYALARNLGHTIIDPVPSLFTFNIEDDLIKDLPGVAFKEASIQIKNSKLNSKGPLLITHWGLSGPGILKLSAWGARFLNELNYNFEIIINFLGKTALTEALETLQKNKEKTPNLSLFKQNPFQLPKRFWERVLEVLNINKDITFAHLSKKDAQAIVEKLCQATLSVNGKSTNKEEFVTAGGIDLKEVNFKTMESKLIPNLYFAGEVLNIDGITGGFNFQAAWSEGFLISKNILTKRQLKLAK